MILGKKVLVTGGAGFIGSHLVERLVKSGCNVRVLDNFSSGKKENLLDVLDKIELFVVDIRDRMKLNEAIKGVDIIFHQAALRSVPASVDDPYSYNDVNVTGTMNILMAAVQEKVNRVIYASSSSVYGDTVQMPEREEFLPRPVSPYAASKLAGEFYCNVFSAIYDLVTVSLRYFNVFGPRQDPHSKYASVVPAFALKMLKDEQPEIHGDGTQSRDFSYVANVVEANILAATVEDANAIKGQVFNIACGEEHSVMEIYECIKEILDKDIPVTYGPRRKGDVRRTLADISKASRLLGYRPVVGFKEGLALTVDWFSKNYT